MPIQWPLDYSFQAGFVGNLYHHLVACKQICIPDTVVIRNHRLVGWWETVATAGGSQARRFHLCCMPTYTPPLFFFCYSFSVLPLSL